MGRPTKRTPEAREIICRAVRLGLDYKTAAQVAGMCYDTLRAWREEDEDFSGDLEKAKGEGKETYAALLLRDAKAGKVAATIFWLKTRTDEFKEHRPEDILDGAQLAERFHARLRELDGYIPSPPADG